MTDPSTPVAQEYFPDAEKRAFARPEPRRVRLDIAYDGSDFRGWATQPGLRTVQGTLEDALWRILRSDVRLVVAGRTDAGVHATGQVAHVDLDEDQWERATRLSSTLR